jgi:hypothetical protein
MNQRNGGINVAWQHQRHRRNDIGNEIMKIGGGSVAASSEKIMARAAVSSAK